MTKQILEEKMVKKKVPVGTTVTCDICGKKILKHEIYFSGYTADTLGEFAHDTMEFFDLCSKECVLKKMDTTITEFEKYPGVQPMMEVKCISHNYNEVVEK